MITDLIKKGAGFVARPSHSRTLGLVLMLVLVAGVSLTVYVAQQQQETRQRAFNENLFTNTTIFDVTTEKCDGYYGGDVSESDKRYGICCPYSNPFYCSKNNQCGTTKDACDNFSPAPQQTPTPTDVPKPPAQPGHPYVIPSLNEKCPNGTIYASSVASIGNICCEFSTPFFCSRDDYRCVASKSECKTSTLPTPTPSQTVCQSAGGTCIPYAPCAPPSVSTDLSCGSSEVCCINPLSIYCGDGTKCPNGYFCDSRFGSDNYCSPEPTAIPTAAQVTIVNTPTPTPVATSSTCINITEVNSLARLYLQGHSTVTLQDVNIKARQYLQNPCQ